MSSFRIPGANKVWAGMFPGNFTGNVWMTRNIDLDRSVGRAVLGDPMSVLVDETDTGFTNLGIVTKWLQTNAADNHATNSRWYALCSNGTTGGRLFRTATAATPPAITSTYEEDASVGVPTDCLDMETHESVNGEQRLLVTRQGDIAILNKSGGANAWDNDWGSTVAGLTLTNTSGYYHPIARLQRLIAIGDGNLVHTIDKNDTVSASRLVLPYGYRVRGIYTSSDRFWIAATGYYGEPALITEWDGFSLAANNEYRLTGSIPLTGFVASNIPHFITELGVIFKYAGGSFEPIQQFPIVEERFLLAETDITQYGATVDRNLVHILANFSGNFASESIRSRSGLWVYNTQNRNLYHRASIGAYKTAGTNPDFGQSPAASVGGIRLSYEQNAVISPFIVAGGKFYSAYSSSTKGAIFRIRANYGGKARASDIGINRGQLILSFADPDLIKGAFEGVWVKFKRFVDADNRIIAKARVVDPTGLNAADVTSTNNQVRQATGTWATTTTFTCVVPTGVEVGDEVEIMSGNGGGCTFHVSALSATPDGSASITVTVDESLPSLNSVGNRGMLARFDNWTKLGTISTTTEGSQKLLAPEVMHGELIQVKLECRGFEVEIDDVIPVYKPITEAKHM